MYSKRRICFACILAFILTACAPAQPTALPEAPVETPAPTPQVNVSDLIADALRHYEAGDYEEAILLYLEAIEIEPRNFEANLWLGKSYRKLGNSADAIPVLQTAYEIDAGSTEAMQELCFAYMDEQQYANAESVAASAWDDGAGGSEAGLMLVIAADAQEKHDDVAEIMQNEELQEAADEILLGESPEFWPYAAKMAVAQAANPDVVGWITIPGTVIDFPIMKAMEDFFYNYHAADKEKKDRGSVYAYYNEAVQGQFYAITGHNNYITAGRSLEPQNDPATMFHMLHHVCDKNRGHEHCQYEKCGVILNDEIPDLFTDKGRIWSLNILGEEGLWEVFSVYEVTDKETAEENLQLLYDNIWWKTGETNWAEDMDTFYPTVSRDTTDIRAWIDKQISRSEFDLGVNVLPEDKILTILTCGANSSQNGERLYFFLHKIG